MMLASQIGAPFGGFREDVVSTLGPLIGQQRINQFLSGMEGYIRGEAEAGARQAIPDIRLEVEAAADAKIRPVAYLAIGAGVLGAILGGFALWRVLRS